MITYVRDYISTSQNLIRPIQKELDLIIQPLQEVVSIWGSIVDEGIICLH